MLRDLGRVCLCFTACSTDAFFSPDAAVDAGVDAVPSDAMMGFDTGCKGPGSACASPAICTNFDATSNQYAPFNTSMTSPGTVALAMDHAVTCPNSMLSTLGPDASEGAHGTISGDITLAGSVASGHASVSADIWLPSSATNIVFLRLAARNASGVTFGVNSGGAFYVFAEASMGSKSITTPVVDAWNHVTLDVMFASVGTITITCDTTGQKQLPTAFDTETLATGDLVSGYHTDVGLEAAGMVTPTVTAWYDDVLLLPE